MTRFLKGIVTEMDSSCTCHGLRLCACPNITICQGHRHRADNSFSRLGSHLWESPNVLHLHGPACHPADMANCGNEGNESLHLQTWYCQGLFVHTSHPTLANLVIW